MASTEIVLYQQFEEVRQTTPSGAEYWSARDLMVRLGYATWQNFTSTIQRAKQSCETYKVSVSRHFSESTKVVKKSDGVEIEIKDVNLSRYACYLVAMNGDTSKPVIAAAQAYFATKTRQQELEDEEVRTGRRIETRERVRSANRTLATAAVNSGVRPENLGRFHDEGYLGMYERTSSEIKRYKAIPENENLLDRASRAELAANEFRITQTEEKLTREKISGESIAKNTHRKVGTVVRETIKLLGGPMPEDMPPEPSIKKLAGQKKKQISEQTSDE